MKEQALSRPWTGENDEPEAQFRSSQLSPSAAAIFKGTDFSNEPNVRSADTEKNNPFFTPPRTPNDEGKWDTGRSIDSFEGATISGGKKDHNERAASAFQSAGLKWNSRECNPHCVLF